MRKTFAQTLYKQMLINKDIILITCDLGYGMWDKIRDTFKDRFFNVGASEQAGMGIAVGLALEGKIPFIYSITPFALYRPFETIRNYLDHEQIPVKIIAGGRDKDYLIDGFSHWSEEAQKVLDIFPNIVQFWPTQKEEIDNCIKEIISNNKPCFISLKR